MISRFWDWTTVWVVMLLIKAKNKGKRMVLGRWMMCMIVYVLSVRVLSDKEVAFVTKWSVQIRRQN